MRRKTLGSKQIPKEVLKSRCGSKQKWWWRTWKGRRRKWGKHTQYI